MKVIELLFPSLILIVAYAVTLGVLYRRAATTGFSKAFFKASTPGAILTIINSGGVYLIVLAISAQYATNAMEFAYNVSAATFGLAMGWVLGIIISPSTKDEQSEFSLLTKAISTFLTGYVLGYVKDIKLDQIQHFLFYRPGVPFRLLIGTACCFSTLAVVFVSRRAEIMTANAKRDWFISYAPADLKHAQGLRADVLARGPFISKEDALAEIERIKVLDEFKGFTLIPVRVEIVGDESPIVPPPPVGSGSGNGDNGNSGERKGDPATSKDLDAKKNESGGDNVDQAKKVPT